MDILVTGGAGYIGSHTCVALLEAGHRCIILDNLCNSKAETISRVEQIARTQVIYYNVNVTDRAAVDLVFAQHKIDAVVHFAGFKSVAESVQMPLAYYSNNAFGTIILAEACEKYGVEKFVFSSSATVYGENEVPFVETMQLLPTKSPYGETKALCERVLADVAKANSKFSVSILRYFNPAGAHKSALIGDRCNGTPNNLMPYVTLVAKGELDRLYIYGNDYPTVDGTGVRDYIHVMDLAEGHVSALNNMRKGVHVYNLGTGMGVSVLQLVETFETVTGAKVPYEIVGRRPGDIAACYADTTKAHLQLGWVARRGLDEMCIDAWRWEMHSKFATKN